MEFTTSSVQLPEGRLRYRVIGPEDSDLPPVVFVHGFLVDGRLWDSVAGILAEQGWRCYLPDLPLGSHVEPVGVRDTLSPRGVARLILAFLADLGLDDVTLVGNDSGGAISQYLLDADPSRIGRLVLTNCDAHDTFPPFPFNVIFGIGRSPRRMRAMLAPMGVRALRHSPLGFGLLADRLDPALTAAWVEPCRRDAAIREEAAAFLRQIDPTDLARTTSRMSRYDGPVTLVWGMRDRCFTPELGRRLAAAFPDARMVEVPHATTFVSLDAPDVVAREIGAVLQR